MTQRHYDQLWRRTEEEVERVVEADKEYVSEDVIEDRPRAYKQAASNYIRYSMCVNKLGKCLDQLVQVQKRQSVQTLLEATLARLLQVKQELVNMDMSDFNYLDEVLLEMKLTPYDVEIQVPQYYRRDRQQKLLKINDDIDRILDELANPPQTDEEEELTLQTTESVTIKDPKEDQPAAPANTERPHPNRPSPFLKLEATISQKLHNSAVLLIQNHERARVARLQTNQIIEKKRIQHDIAWQIYKPKPVEVVERAVRQIQKWWKKCRAYKHEHHRLGEKRLLLGEVTPSWRPKDQEARALAVEEECRGRQQKADDAYSEDRKRLETVVRRRDADVMDDMADHIRWWVENWYRKLEDLPEFPEETPVALTHLMGLPQDCPEDWIKKAVPVVTLATAMYPGLPEKTLGGSALIVGDFWVDPTLYELAHTVTQLNKGKKGGKVEKKEKLTKQQLKEQKEEKKEKERLEKEAKKKELEEKQARGVVPNPTTQLDILDRDLDKIKGLWSMHVDPEWDPDQVHRTDIPRQEFVHDQEKELRLIVDDLMRLELVRLQAALDRDRGMKRKGDKKKKKKKPKGKKGKKDLTADRTQESLFRELVENGIIKKTEDIRIDSFFCEPSWKNWDLRRDPWNDDPPPNLWDVKQVVKEYCILPLGSATVHRAAPLVRSVLLAGQRNLAVDQLALAVAAEAGAVLFDLSPSNTAGKYPGKKGLNMLVHLVTKMSRLMQPSVIFINGGEKPFYKKVPKTEKAENPKLLKKQLPKMVKGVTAEDQVLFLASSENPLAGQGKAMAKTYNKILPLAVPDQSSSAAYWHHQLMKYHGIDRDFLYSPVAWCAQGYPQSVIDRVLREVLPTKRILELKYRPLDPQELLDTLLTQQADAVTEDQRKQLFDWFRANYPMARKRAEKLKAEGELREKLAALEAKKEKEKKKK